jgi:26S proteasome regulatory subunit (ATPase 3-interacting protein)
MHLTTVSFTSYHLFIQDIEATTLIIPHITNIVDEKHKQEEIDPSSIDAQLHSLDTSTTALREETTKLKAEEKDLRAHLRSSIATSSSNNQANQTAAISSIPDLHSSITHLEAEKSELETRLAMFQGGDGSGKEVVMIDQTEKERILADHGKWMKILRARRKIRWELWEEVREIVGREKEGEVKEELGLEF